MNTPEGVEIRGKSIRISFTYREMRCRETLKGWEVTKGNLKKASHIRASILSEISLGTFDYLSRFPTSRKAQLFATPEQRGKNLTVRELFDDYIQLKKTTMASQSLYVLSTTARACCLFVGEERTISTITIMDALKCQKLMVDSPTRNGRPRSAKTINNMIKLMRRCFDLAVKSKFIDDNPFLHVELLSGGSGEPDPLELEEFHQLIESTTNLQQRNMFTLAIYTGMRTGELCALAWEDVDLEKGTIEVTRNVTIERKFTTPKNKKSERTIHLLEPALLALKSQRELTMFSPVRDILVEVKGSNTFRQESVRFVFIPERRNGQETSETYKTTTYNRLWSRALKRASIRHRCSYQSRHTYACWLITKGANLSFIAEQMGHKSTMMLERFYGRFMKSHSHEQIEYLNGIMASKK
ncbi:tyrosine-type recombinase/integrase [Vibrio alginolyticus]|nr:tyrosine-type recombinase/integrase [Vibrio alginolyticus]MCR9313397.1 site-specific integrase [Vibrio alginolyticus]MCR9318328.1 site-specific integrase [Vibrio alginolyticus]MCR9403312.1 site-specific integrase [Vibrio alginolyticus]MCR9467130.1 site-specific integrase [Vibrio alginolyticus]MCR9479479.1 site-specific integrase [Vibrio alginolyticus]